MFKDYYTQVFEYIENLEYKGTYSPKPIDKARQYIFMVAKDEDNECDLEGDVLSRTLATVFPYLVDVYTQCGEWDKNGIFDGDDEYVLFHVISQMAVLHELGYRIKYSIEDMQALKDLYYLSNGKKDRVQYLIEQGCSFEGDIDFKPEFIRFSRDQYFEAWETYPARGK